MILVAVLLVVAAGGCGGGKGDAGVSTPAVRSDRPPSLQAACGTTEGLSATPMWLRTADGVRLYAVQAGTGSTTVVLAHEGRSDLCASWLPYAKRLVASGFRTLLFDFRGNGRSESVGGDRALRLDRDLAATVRRARALGARRVFLIGASLGGAAVVQNGAVLPVDGIVSLSGTRIWPGFGINHYRSLPRLRVPFLYLGSAEDPNAPETEARGIFRRIGSTDKRKVLFRGSLHGTAFVDSAAYAPRARALILGWLRRHEDR